MPKAVSVVVDKPNKNFEKAINQILTYYMLCAQYDAETSYDYDEIPKKYGPTAYTSVDWYETNLRLPSKTEDPKCLIKFNDTILQLLRMDITNVVNNEVDSSLPLPQIQGDKLVSAYDKLNLLDSYINNLVKLDHNSYKVLTEYIHNYLKFVASSCVGYIYLCGTLKLKPELVQLILLQVGREYGTIHVYLSNLRKKTERKPAAPKASKAKATKSIVTLLEEVLDEEEVEEVETEETEEVDTFDNL